MVARLALVLALTVLAMFQDAEAQPQAIAKVYRIGFLSSGFPLAQGVRSQFLEGLRAFGWVEGRDFVIDSRYAEGRADRLPALAAELLRLKVDVIAAGGGTAAVAAKDATGTVPIVMIGAGDPVGLGLVASLSRPGGNVTGVAWDVGLETFSKSLELLKEALPGVRHVAILSNPANPGQALAVGNIRTAAASLRLEVRFLEARNENDLERAFASLTTQRAEAMLILTDTMFIGQRARLAELATRYRVPSMFGVREYVEAGGLLSYGPNLAAAFQRAGYFTGKILKGAKPADLPVEQPTKFELIINLKTASMLGTAIPQSLLLRADQVIE